MNDERNGVRYYVSGLGQASVNCTLPHSLDSPYDSASWEKAKVYLTALRDSSGTDLLLQMVNLMSKADSAAFRFGEDDSTNQKLCGLRMVLQELVKEDTYKYEQLFPSAVASLAMEIEKQFPVPQLPVMQPGVEAMVVLTRRQVAVLVAHMFLCTMLPQTWNKYSVSLRVWHMHAYLPTQAYLRVVIDYLLEAALTTDSKWNTEPLYFIRRSAPDDLKWQGSKSTVVATSVFMEGSIGDVDDDEAIEVDFANMDVGFGEYGTQEELLFGMSPEMLPLVLFSTTLGARESLLICGVKRYGTYTGYGMTATYAGPYLEERNWNKRIIVAMDALDLHEKGKNSLSAQLEESNMLRELKKAYSAFQPISLNTNSAGRLLAEELNRHNYLGVICTGHWGCGAFKGDKEVKATLQLLAASAANCPSLVFYAHGDNKFSKRFGAVLRVIREHTVRVGQIYKMLNQFRSNITSNEESFFAWFLHHDFSQHTEVNQDGYIMQQLLRSSAFDPGTSSTASAGDDTSRLCDWLACQASSAHSTESGEGGSAMGDGSHYHTNP